jgi:hypothetical protein
VSTVDLNEDFCLGCTITNSVNLPADEYVVVLLLNLDPLVDSSQAPYSGFYEADESCLSTGHCISDAIDEYELRLYAPAEAEIVEDDWTITREYPVQIFESRSGLDKTTAYHKRTNGYTLRPADVGATELYVEITEYTRNTVQSFARAADRLGKPSVYSDKRVYTLGPIALDVSDVAGCPAPVVNTVYPLPGQVLYYSGARSNRDIIELGGQHTWPPIEIRVQSAGGVESVIWSNDPETQYSEPLRLSGINDTTFRLDQYSDFYHIIIFELDHVEFTVTSKCGSSTVHRIDFFPESDPNPVVELVDAIATLQVGALGTLDLRITDAGKDIRSIEAYIESLSSSEEVIQIGVQNYGYDYLYVDRDDYDYEVYTQSPVEESTLVQFPYGPFDADPGEYELTIIVKGINDSRFSFSRGEIVVPITVQPLPGYVSGSEEEPS